MAPYLHELANPLGFSALFQEEVGTWLENRLKTYGSKPHGEEDKYVGLKKIYRKDLPEATSFTKFVAVDGSLASIEEPAIAALKIASVWGDSSHEVAKVGGVIDPASLADGYHTEHSVGLVPGKGVYPKGKEGSWDMKLREEFYHTLKHMKIHRSSRSYSLIAWLRNRMGDYLEKNPLRCPNCSSERIDFGDTFIETFCEACGSDVYFSDYLSSSLFVTGGSATSPMLICEQLLLHGLVGEIARGNIADHTLENTLFVADGPLRLFNLRPIVEILQSTLRSYRPIPGMVSFLKSGHIENIFSSQAAEDSLSPGEIALITEEMRGGKKGDFEKQAHSGLYGKSFAYRTEEGSKRFGFMIPPMRGDLQLGGAPVLDDWSTYPHLRAICDFIEANQTNENGPQTPALELIGRANHGASLPAVLSKKILRDIVAEHMN